MKVSVTLKDPDAVYEAVEDAIENWTPPDGLDSDEIEAVKEARKEKVNALMSQWFEYGEYVTIDVDTEAKTATVRPVQS